MKKTLTLFIFLIGSVSVTVAQTYKVTGCIKGAKTSVSYAAVSVLSVADSSSLQSFATDEKGNYQFNTTSGKYILSITAVGYLPGKYSLNVLADTKVTDIILKKSNNVLNEVTINGKKPYIETGVGKTTVNVEQAATTAGSNVLDLLRKAPGVMVDGNGNVTLQGNGVLITIDDKQTYLAGDQLADYLKSLPAEQVAQLELINQPPAKYDAEGSGGVINIKMRKSKKAGISGNVALAFGSGLYPNTHNSALVNYKKDKFDVYVNAGYMHATGFLNQETHRQIHDPATGELLDQAAQYTFLKEVFEDYSLKTGADYSVSDKTTIGGSIGGTYHPNHERGTTNSEVVNNTSDIYNEFANYNRFHRDNLTVNVYGKSKFAKDQEISAEGDYLVRTLNENRDFSSDNYYANTMQPAPDGLLLREKMLSNIKALVGKIDYAGSFKDDWKVEAGIKTDLVKTDNGAYFNVMDGNVWKYDSTRTNDFLYTENINAVYVSLSKSLSKKWQVQGGMRVENMNVHGKQLMNGQEFTIKKTNVFPTAYISYKANDKNSFDLNYGIRINRPNYIELNPFINYLSQYSYNTGNPLIRPQYRQFAELSYNHNGEFISAIGCRKITNNVNPVVNYDPATQALYSSAANNATKYVLQVSESYNKQLFDWWMLSTSAELYYNRYLLYGLNAAIESTGFSISASNQFNFKKGWSVDTFIAYNGGMLQNAIERNGDSYWLGFNVSKKIWKDTATIKLSVDDPFDDYRYKPSKNWNGIATASTLHYATREVALGFTYNIGKKMESRSVPKAVEESERM